MEAVLVLLDEIRVISSTNKIGILIMLVHEEDTFLKTTNILFSHSKDNFQCKNLIIALRERRSIEIREESLLCNWSGIFIT